jgi:CheY-like chemotaxis protein
LRILILEDDPLIACDLQAILEGVGHEIVGMLDSVARAYECLETGFDYALLDIDVIGGKSFGVATALVERQIPFAFVSASCPADIPQSLQQVALIPKPFEEKAILQSVGQVASVA